MSQETPYNPLDKKNLGVSVADALLASIVHPLPPKEPFNGAGIYAIYNVGHFHCRYLVLDEIWIPLGENMLIEQFKPVWNQIVEGFGNKTPGAKRFAGRKPLWDTLHPGRSWAGKMTGESKRTQEEILQAVNAFLQADSEK